MPLVVIRHPKTDEEFQIDSADFRRGHHYQQSDGSRVTYADAGFRVVGMADGSAYTGPLNTPPEERGSR